MSQLYMKILAYKTSADIFYRFINVQTNRDGKIHETPWRVNFINNKYLVRCAVDINEAERVRQLKVCYSCSHTGTPWGVQETGGRCVLRGVPVKLNKDNARAGTMSKL